MTELMLVAIAINIALLNIQLSRIADVLDRKR